MHIPYLVKVELLFGICSVHPLEDADVCDGEVGGLEPRQQPELHDRHPALALTQPAANNGIVNKKK